ncbi:unnamed protein product [[Candida] boidinii]|uniref:Unnamed protein product n=1 Tax=Candida boidinii TaxID=5477 RepID=A0A9W6T6X7_CANBO|nr:unnamed protein product [[Candida] boidinii]
MNNVNGVNFSLGSSRQNSTDTVIRQQQQQQQQEAHHNESRACSSASTRSSLASITSPVFKANNNSNSDISSPGLNNASNGNIRKDKDTESLVSFPGSSGLKYQENNGLGLGFVTSQSNTDLVTPVTPYSANNILSSHNNSKSSTPISIGTINPATANSIKQQKKGSTTKAVIQTPTGPIVPFTEYMSKEDDDKIHILIGATGSVATIKIPMIIDKLFKIYGVDKVSIQLVVTESAEHFLKGLKISTEVKIWREKEEWANPMTKPGDPILHVELRKWADIFLIAPLSANTLAKISNGLADNLLTSIVRIWNPAIPIIVSPAMNTFMYTHPVTKRQLNILNDDFKFIEVLKPIEKVLVCGDIGMGGMREWSEIVDILVKRLKDIQKAKKIAEARLDPDLVSG